ncbi:bis(5'-nucleosyl)-tetraphosphatase (symmetrical) YqeK [Lachnospiraceae bacterium ZAX-1]
MEMKKIQKHLKKALDKERYEHTLGVMYTAAALAMAHDCDLQKAQLAGLLHDCAKCIPNDEKIRLCALNNIEITPQEQSTPFLLHAKLGAFMAKEIYKVKDNDILHAILVHTTGAPRMSVLDKIVYVADYIEPQRDRAPDLVAIRKLAFQNLDDAMLKILSNTLRYLEYHKSSIDPATSATYEYLKNELRFVGGFSNE